VTARYNYLLSIDIYAAGQFISESPVYHLNFARQPQLENLTIFLVEQNIKNRLQTRIFVS